VEEALAIESVEDALREIVGLVLEDRTPPLQLDELERSGRGGSRAGVVEHPLRRNVDPEELPGNQVRFT